MPDIVAKRVLPTNMLKSARHISDMLALWALCEQRGCRTRGQCSAVPPTCWKNCIKLTPGPVSEFVFTLFSGREQNLSFDEALRRVPEELGEEWSAWHDAVTRMTGRPSMKPLQPKPDAVTRSTGRPS